MVFFYFFLNSSAFLPGLLPCVRTNDLAYVRHTSEGAWTVRDLGPIYSDLWDPFATVELRLLSVRCLRLLYSCLVSNVEHYIFCGRIVPFHARKFWAYVESRSGVLSFRSPMFFHCISWPWLLCSNFNFKTDFNFTKRVMTNYDLYARPARMPTRNLF